tara:strand:- start:211 stop:348 length:138 start_codon:yes stop_codon:yes gene_type:complete
VNKQEQDDFFALYTLLLIALCLTAAYFAKSSVGDKNTGNNQVEAR